MPATSQSVRMAWQPHPAPRAPRLPAALVGVLLAAFATVSLADEAKEELIKKDRKQIEGTWRVVELEVDGNVASEEDARKLTVVNSLDGTWILRHEGNEIARGTSTLDPTARPKAIDFMVTEGEAAGNSHLGIYEPGEKTRKLCFAPAGRARPAEFSAPSGSEHVLVKFARE